MASARWTPEEYAAFRARKLGTTYKEVAAKTQPVRLPTEPKKTKAPPPREAETVKAVLQLLTAHPKVALAWRQNSGAVQSSYTRKDGSSRSRFVRFNACDGISDICGFLTDGRFLAIECKRIGGKATEAQLSFLAAVRHAGGIAVLAFDVSDVSAILSALDIPEKHLKP